MPKVTIDGVSIELTSSQLLDLVGNAAVAIFHSSEGVFASHQFGSPDKLQYRFETNLRRDLDLLKTLEMEMGPEIGLAAGELRDSLVSLLRTGDEMIEWLATSVTPAASNDEAEGGSSVERSGLGKGAAPGSFSFPEWMQRPEYRELLQKAFLHMEGAINAIGRLLEGLLPLCLEAGTETERESEQLLARKIEQMKPIFQEGLESMIRKAASGQLPDSK